MQFGLIRDHRVRLNTLATIQETIATYCQRYQIDPVHQESFSLLDGLIITQILDMLPEKPEVWDLNPDATAGLNSLVLLHQIRASHVHTVQPGDVLAASLTNWMTRQSSVGPSLTIADRVAPEVLRSEYPVAVLHAAGQPEEILVKIGDCLAWHPHVIVLLTGLKDLLACPLTHRLIAQHQQQNQFSLFFPREQTECLGKSRMAVIARTSEQLEPIRPRLINLYSGNFRTLQLLWNQSLQAMHENKVNERAMATHPSGAFMFHELNQAKAEVERLKARVAELEHQSHHQQVHIGGLNHLLHLSQQNTLKRKARRIIAPDGTRRQRIIIKLRRGWSYWKQHGTFRTLKRIVKK
jgi:hypothetical protein